MSLIIYLIGFAFVIGGIAWALIVAKVSTLYVMIAVVILIGIAILKGWRMFGVFSYAGARINGNVFRRIYQYAIAFGGNIKWNRRMGTAVICTTIMIHMQLKDAATLVNSFKVQTQSIQCFLFLQRKPQVNMITR